MRILIVLSFFAISQCIAAQRGGDGGLVIQNLFVDGMPLKVMEDVLVNNDGLISARLEHFVLNSHGNPSKQLPNFTNARYYDVNTPSTFLIYLPAYNGPVEPKNAIPNQRLTIEIKGQKMIVDFLEIVRSNAPGYFNLIKSIVFKPGHYKVNFDVYNYYSDVLSIDRSDLQLVSSALETGINTGNNDVLYKYRVLTYFEINSLKNKLDERISAPVDSSAWLKLHRIGADSISFFANGILYSNGACDANVLINMQILLDGVWTDFHSSWSQMDCGMPYLFVNNKGGITNVNGLNVPGTQNPLPAGEYRYATYAVDGEFLVSESFVISERLIISPTRYKYLERTGFGMHGVDVQPKQIYIRTPYEPEIQDGIPHYFFSYYYISDMLRAEILQQNNPDEYYYKQLADALRISSLEVNNELFTGRLKLELRKLEYAPDKKYMSNDLYIIDYSEGKLVEFKTFDDVDLNSEARRIR